LGNQTRGKDGSARDETVDVALNVTTSPYKSPLLLSMHRNGACPVTQWFYSAIFLFQTSLISA
ncbi:MAG: hypothetical protein ACXW37_13000, partial [Nitrospira sp.]